VFVTGLSVLPAFAISSVSSSAWSVDKLRMVVIGTTFIIGLVMSLVGEFCLVKPKPASDQ
jgi:hypothetical protein